MKTTGIIRRIDELGRIVVPVEIRKNLRIKEGDSLEIFLGADEEIILKKYSHIEQFYNTAKKYAEILAKTTQHNICIIDTSGNIVTAGMKKYTFSKDDISNELYMALNNRKNILANAKEEDFVYIFNKEVGIENEIICPIIINGDVCGAVIIFCCEQNAKFDNAELMLASCTAQFIACILER